MDETTKRTILQALEIYRGDDLCRAKATFQGLNWREMQEQHGHSSLTRQETLDTYQEHEDRINAAIAEVNG